MNNMYMYMYVTMNKVKHYQVSCTYILVRFSPNVMLYVYFSRCVCLLSCVELASLPGVGSWRRQTHALRRRWPLTQMQWTYSYTEQE